MPTFDDKVGALDKLQWRVKKFKITSQNYPRGPMCSWSSSLNHLYVLDLTVGGEMFFPEARNDIRRPLMEQLLEASALGDACCRTLSMPPVHKPALVTYHLQNVCIVQLPLWYRNRLRLSSSTLLLQHVLLRPLAGLCVSHGAATLAGPLDKSLGINTWAAKILGKSRSTR